MPETNLQVNVSTEQGEANLRRMNQEFYGVSQAADAVGNSLGRIEKMQTIQFFATLVSTVKDLSHSYVEMGKIVNDFILSQAEENRSLILLSKSIGIVSDDLEAMGNALQINGVGSFEDLVTMSNKLAKSLIDSSGRITATGKSLQGFGVNIYDANGGLRDTGKILEDTIDKMLKLGTSTETTALAAQLFGKSGPMKINSLIAEGYSSVADIVKKVGIGFSTPEQVRALSDYKKNIETLKITWSEVNEAAAGGLAKLMNPVLENISRSMRNLSPSAAMAVGLGGLAIKGLPELIKVIAELTIVMAGMKAGLFGDAFTNLTGGAIAGSIINGSRERQIRLGLRTPDPDDPRWGQAMLRKAAGFPEERTLGFAAEEGRMRLSSAKTFLPTKEFERFNEQINRMSQGIALSRKEAKSFADTIQLLTLAEEKARAVAKLRYEAEIAGGATRAEARAAAAAAGGAAGQAAVSAGKAGLTGGTGGIVGGALKSAWGVLIAVITDPIVWIIGGVLGVLYLARKKIWAEANRWGELKNNVDKGIGQLGTTDITVAGRPKTVSSQSEIDREVDNIEKKILKERGFGANLWDKVNVFKNYSRDAATAQIKFAGVILTDEQMQKMEDLKKKAEDFANAFERAAVAGTEIQKDIDDILKDQGTPASERRPAFDKKMGEFTGNARSQYADLAGQKKAKDDLIASLIALPVGGPSIKKLIHEAELESVDLQHRMEAVAKESERIQKAFGKGLDIQEIDEKLADLETTLKRLDAEQFMSMSGKDVVDSIGTENTPIGGYRYRKAGFNDEKWQKEWEKINLEYDKDILEETMTKAEAKRKYDLAIFELKLKTFKELLDREKELAQATLSNIDASMDYVLALGDTALSIHLQKQRDLIEQQLIAAQADLAKLGDPKEVLTLSTMRLQEQLRLVQQALSNISIRYDRLIKQTQELAAAWGVYASAVEASQNLSRARSANPNSQIGQGVIDQSKINEAQATLRAAQLERDKGLARVEEQRKANGGVLTQGMRDEIQSINLAYQTAYNTFKGNIDNLHAEAIRRARNNVVEVLRLQADSWRAYSEYLGVLMTIQQKSQGLDEFGNSRAFTEAEMQDRIDLIHQQARAQEELSKREREAALRDNDVNNDEKANRDYANAQMRIKFEEEQAIVDLQKEQQTRYNAGLADEISMNEAILEQGKLLHLPMEEQQATLEIILKLKREYAAQLASEGKITESIKVMNEAITLEQEKQKKLSFGQELLLAGTNRSSIESFLKDRFNDSYSSLFTQLPMVMGPATVDQLVAQLQNNLGDTLTSIFDQTRAQGLPEGQMQKINEALTRAVGDVVLKIFGRR